MTDARPAPRLSATTLVERARAEVPALVAGLVDAAAQSLSAGVATHAIGPDREQIMPVLEVLQGRRAALVRGLEAALHQALGGAAATAPRDGNGVLTLSLISEDRVDEDIEIARVVQQVESRAEWELAQLSALASSALGLDGIRADAAPLRPAQVGRAMREACLDLGLPGPARLRLLRELGAAAAPLLCDRYFSLADWLRDQGVQPAGYRIRPTPGAGAPVRGADVPAATGPRSGTAPGRPGPAGAGPAAFAPAGAAGFAPAGASPRAASPLARLVERARAEARQTPAPAAGVVALRLLDEPVDPARFTGLDPATAADVMARLLALLVARLPEGSGLKDVVDRLGAPAAHLAANDAGLWQSLDHPWWQLLDRVVAAGEVADDQGHDGATSLGSLTRALDVLVNDPTPDAQACRRAVDGLDEAVTSLIDALGPQIADQAAAMEARVDQALDRAALERELRAEVVAQLRGVPVPAGLRPFLVGPWVTVLATVAVTHGRDSPEFAGDARFVDLLLTHVQHNAGLTAPPELVIRLVQRAARGLREAEFDKGRAEALLKDLHEVLSAPQIDDEPGAAPAPVAADTGPDSLLSVPPALASGLTAASPALPAAGPATAPAELHGGLPTVPIEMDEADQGRLAPERAAWLDGLAPGDCCRLFILGRWVTARLQWRSDNGTMFVFSSRHGGRLHSLSRRALDKLRGAGLATTIDAGQLLGQAMDALGDFTPRGPAG